jgi:hypothetical protein
VTITTPPDRPDRCDDFIRLYRLIKRTPALPYPQTAGARATFDYRHVVLADIARQSVAFAATVLGGEFGVTFPAKPRTELAGDGTPRYLLEALLPSGLTLVIISRVEHVADQDDREDAPQLASVAA